MYEYVDHNDVTRESASMLADPEVQSQVTRWLTNKVNLNTSGHLMPFSIANPPSRVSSRSYDI